MQKFFKVLTLVILTAASIAYTALFILVYYNLGLGLNVEWTKSIGIFFIVDKITAIIGGNNLKGWGLIITEVGISSFLVFSMTLGSVMIISNVTKKFKRISGILIFVSALLIIGGILMIALVKDTAQAKGISENIINLFNTSSTPLYTTNIIY
ncbi:MAG: hypothetical protein ACRC4M_00165 [Mycoplasma sp.]